MKLVSVIVPVFNPGKVFEDCLKSIIGQTYTDFEIILIDDGSDDGSEKICDEYAAHYDFITLKHLENGGVSRARNVGISLAKGEYILFIDSDDQIEKNTLEECVTVMEKGGVDLVAYGMNIVRYSKNGIKTDIKSLEKEEKLTSSEIAERFCELFYADYLSSSCTKMFCRRVITDNNIRFDENLSMYEDLCFVLDYISFSHSVLFMKQAFYHYRMECGQYAILKRVSDDLLKNIDKVACRIHDFVVVGGDGIKQTDANVLLDLYTIYLQRIFLNSLTKKQLLSEIKRLLSIELFRKSARLSNAFDKGAKFYRLLIFGIRHNIPILIYILYRKRYPRKEGV